MIRTIAEEYPTILACCSLLSLVRIGQNHKACCLLNICMLSIFFMDKLGSMGSLSLTVKSQNDGKDIHCKPYHCNFCDNEITSFQASLADLCPTYCPYIHSGKRMYVCQTFCSETTPPHCMQLSGAKGDGTSLLPCVMKLCRCELYNHEKCIVRLAAIIVCLSHGVNYRKFL